MKFLHMCLGKVMPVEYFSEPVRSQDGDIVLQASQQEVCHSYVHAYVNILFVL